MAGPVVGFIPNGINALSSLVRGGAHPAELVRAFRTCADNAYISSRQCTAHVRNKLTSHMIAPAILPNPHAALRARLGVLLQILLRGRLVFLLALLAVHLRFVLLAGQTAVHGDLAADAVLRLADAAVEDGVALGVVLREDVAEGAGGGGAGAVGRVVLEGGVEERGEVVLVCVLGGVGFDLGFCEGEVALRACDLVGLFGFDLGFEVGVPAGGADSAAVVVWFVICAGVF